ncbi:MAG: carboxypeptidase regulatory-like domain-containing protein [Bryobacteraceae bacterium]
MKRLCFRALVGLVATSLLTFAQTSTGQIAVTVLDPTGAVVPGATVTLTGSDTGELVRTLTTDELGTATAPLLRPGAYTVAATHEGFKRLERSGVTLRVADALSLRLTLEPGGVTESISVTAQAELLEERTHSVGQVVDDRTMQQLPLNGRNYLQLGNLTAGAVPNTRSRDRTFSAYGNRGLQNAFLLDGARNTNYLRGLDNRARDAMRPSLEAISEFKVQTSNFSAEYGASAGAVVNVVTRSGTNQFHGSAFEFIRNSAFDARDFFTPASSSKPLYVQHQYGGSLGGPVRQNRAWFMASYQRTHISQGDNVVSSVPTLAQKSGVFGSTPIYDPATSRANPAGTGSVRDLFPGNTIPATRFDRIGKQLADYYPNPQFATAARNYVNIPIHGTRFHNATFRGDVRLSDQDSLFGRFSFDDGSFNRKSPLPEPATTGTIRDQPARSVGVGYTRVVTPTTVNELRFAWNRVGVIQDGTVPRDEIIPGSLDADVTSSIPTFGVTGFTQLGAPPAGFGNLPLDKSSGVWNISDNISSVRGKHTIKAGFDYQLIRVITSATLQGRGSWAFNGVFTQNPQSRPRTGSPVADLLLGLPNSITIGTRGVSQEREHNTYWYFQDDWQVTPSLTFNLGVRYEITRPFYEIDNRLANLITDWGDPFFGEYILAGDSRRPRSLQYTDYNNIAPRFGFAWRTPATGLVLRGGFGIFYGQDEGFGVSQRTTNNPPFVGFGGFNVTSDQVNIRSTIPLSSALPPRPAPVDAASYRYDPNATVQLRSWTNRFTLPYVEQWTLSMQKEIVPGTLWELNYVGNHGVKLWGVYQGNQPLPGPGAVNNRRPLTGISRASIIRAEPWVNSSYHGLSTRLERRFSKGLSFLASYTYGRSLDTQSNVDLCDGCVNSSGVGSVQDSNNRKANRGPSDHNVPHRFVFSGGWDLPFSRDNVFARGWTLAGILTFSSGLPFTLNLPFDNANIGSVNWPNRIADGRLDNRGIDRWFDAAAFTFPAQYTFGNAGRGYLTGPGTKTLDFSLQRSFDLPINDVSRIEFRAEAFNAFNTPQFGIPGATLNTPQFGTIGGTAGPNRQLQFGLRFLF